MKTLQQCEKELYDKILEIFTSSKCKSITISTHDGGEVEILNNDIEYGELEINIS